MCGPGGCDVEPCCCLYHGKLALLYNQKFEELKFTVGESTDSYGLLTIVKNKSGFAL